MSYQPLSPLKQTSTAIASPRSINFVTFSTNVSASNGASIPASTITATLGSALSLNSGAVVLPVGYWYYIEGTTQAQVPSGTTSVSDYVDVQWHDGTNYIGSIGRTVCFDRADASTVARDEKALALIDATSVAVTVTFKMVTASGLVTVINSTGTHQEYAGRSRAMIIQLDAP